MSHKEDALENVYAEINKRWGAGSLAYGSELKKKSPVDYITTGSIALDLIMGGGFPRSNITTVFGDQSVGKSTLGLHSCAAVQQAGGVAAYIKMENWLPPDYAMAIGVDMDKLLISQPETGEKALEIAEQLMRTGQVQVVVVDSIPALIPESRATGQFKDKNYGDVANLLSRTLKQLSDAANYGNSALVFTNQVRPTIGATSLIPGYVVTHMAGGYAIRFYSDIIVRLTRQMDKDPDVRTTQQNVTALVEKNRLSAPQGKAKFVIEYGKGIDRMADLVSVAIDKELIEKSGSWFVANGVKYHGLEALVEAVRADEVLAGELEKGIRA